MSDKKPEKNGPDKTDAKDSASTKSRNNKILITVIAILSTVIIALAGYMIVSQNKGTQEPVVKTVLVKKTPVKVKSLSLTGEVPQKTNFTITFSQNVVSESSVNVQLDSVPIDITPSIPGKYKWLAKHRLGFFPDVELLPSTKYTAEILPEICSAEDLYLTGKTQFEFHTPFFKVEDAPVSFKFSDKDKGRVKIKAAVEFNYPVRVGALKEKLSIFYKGGEKIPYQIITEGETGSIIELETEEIIRGERDRSIRLKIEKGLKCVDGTLGLSGDYTSPIVLKSQKPLRVEWMNPNQQAGKVCVSIRVSSPVDANVAKEYITVTPETDYHIVSNYRYLELRGDFKPGSAYTVTIKKGLRAQDDSVLKGNFSKQVTMRDMEPSISFVGDGIYLSKDGNLNVGLSTINVNKIQIEIDKVFANNLVYLIASGNMRSRYGNINNLGKSVYRGNISMSGTEPRRYKRNEEIITPVNLKKYLADERIGIFKVSAYQANNRWRRASKWVMITDLGIMAKRTGNELLVWVNSLASLKPIKNAEVTLISRNNQTLLSGSTNKDGVVTFESFSDKIEGFKPFLLTASYGKDLSFLELNKRRIPTTDFDVGGKPVLSGGYDAFVYTDRGVYRPGESANCVTIVRGKNNAAPSQFPIKMQVLGPDNKILREFRGQLNREGACEFKVSLPEYIKTGRYLAKVIAATKEIGRTGFSVEEFMPDRIKVKVETDKANANVGEEVKINVEGQYLFGAPVAGGEVYADCSIEAKRFSLPQWSSFAFADDERTYKRQDIQLGEDNLDDKGQYAYTLKIPADIKPPSSLRAVIAATVSEPGGRAVSAYKAIDIHPYSHYVGIRRTEEGYAEIDKDTKIEYIVVDHDGKATSGRKLKVSCYYLRWHTIMKWVDGHYRYTSERQKELLKSFDVTSHAKVGFFQFKPTDYGEYKIEIEDASGASAATRFYASGWGYAPWAMENPDRLEIGLDKTSYLPGDVAKAQIRAPFAGKLIVTVERGKIYNYRVVMMKENTGEIDIPVLDGYAPNVYISASLIRSTKSLERHAPARAFGIVPLKIDNAQNRLAIKLDTVGEIKPKEELTVNFTIATLPSRLQSKPYVTIAAVDEGICQLTNFRTPEPHAYFFAKRRHSIASYDIYSAVLPEVEPASTSSSTGGDGVDAARKKHLSPVSVQRVKPVSLWSGLVEADENGNGSVTFNIPQFNGSIRVMAIAFAGDKFGSASQNVMVREPILLMPTYPRFVAGGDVFKIPVSIFNNTGKQAEFEVKLEAVGPVDILENSQPMPEALRTISLEKGGSGQILWESAAHNWIGKATFNLSAKGGGESTSQSTDLPVRPSVPPITLTGNGVVTADQPATFAFSSNWLEGTADFSITLSAFPAVKFTNSLRYLVGYPYG